MAVTNHGDRIQLAANSDLSTKRYYLVKEVSDSACDLVSANTDVVLGSIQNKPRLGETVDIANAAGHATFKVQLGGTVTRGQRVCANGSGLTVAATQTTAGSQPVIYSFGEALQSGVSGDIIEVRGGPILY